MVTESDKILRSLGYADPQEAGEDDYYSSDNIPAGERALREWQRLNYIREGTEWVEQRQAEGDKYTYTEADIVGIGILSWNDKRIFMDTFSFAFGKYEGMDWEGIWESDPAYVIQWIENAPLTVEEIDRQQSIIRKEISLWILRNSMPVSKLEQDSLAKAYDANSVKVKSPQPITKTRELRFPAGKYKGETLSEVWAKDEKWARWYITNNNQMTPGEFRKWARVVKQIYGVKLTRNDLDDTKKKLW